MVPSDTATRGSIEASVHKSPSASVWHLCPSYDGVNGGFGAQNNPSSLGAESGRAAFNPQSTVSRRSLADLNTLMKAGYAAFWKWTLPMPVVDCSFVTHCQVERSVDFCPARTVERDALALA